ncbi:hypothetical protein HU200_066104 [Digitaria exilis]|uniref:Uncharacterized protein n=1 Tax=Digitaria exilis TaxID=1010633 RepID=A0A835A897_9POAL|nr:hypothetical protein HU200_066104 [Digitaria exilis]
MSMDTTHIFLLTNPNSMERKCTTCDLSISTRGNMRMWRGRRSGVLASHTAAYHDEGVAGDGEAGAGFECCKGNTILTCDIDKLERTATVDDGHCTVAAGGCAIAIAGNRQLVEREPDEGDGRVVGQFGHVTQRMPRW